MAAEGSTEEDIDELLYSRQLFVLGYDAMVQMAHSKVLISGMKGLGAEVAKNIVMVGVKSVTIRDPDNADWIDLSSQFFLSEEDIGKNRADVVQPRLAQLSTDVRVHIYHGPLTEDIILQFQVIVLTNSTLEEQIQVGELCHDNGIKFIVADTKGLAGKIFCDFGDFVVSDVDGVDPKSRVIGSITKAENGVVSIVNQYLHEYSDGDYVTFSNIHGMTELNNCKPVKIKVINRYSFSIGDTSELSAYESGGTVTSVKMTTRISFQSIKQSLETPSFVVSDHIKQDHQRQLHMAFLALDEFIKRRGKLPKIQNQEDADMFVSVVKEYRERSASWLEELNEDLLRNFCKGASGDVCPMASVIGGIASQEVIKACTGKFNPIVQFLYFDALECLPEENKDNVLTEEACQPRRCRYDGQISLFGEAFQKKLGNSLFFLIGAGAIGCEMLKNWAMTGLACGEQGMVFVTDMDLIEKSNLNRQFLFRPWDLQKPKSPTAAEAVRRINPDLKIMAHQNKLGSDMENVYTQSFFEGLDGVVTAVDNIDARLYMDSQCIYYHKPLVDAGMDGLKAHVQVVIPNMTESYSSSEDPPGKCVPISTIGYFPFEIEHTVEWARHMFEIIFSDPMSKVLEYLTEPQFIDKTLKMYKTMKLDKLETVKKTLVDEFPKEFRDCVTFARNLWQKYYRTKIQQLVYNFPADQVTSSGAPFWTGVKRCPHSLAFHPDNELHLRFVVASATLHAQMYGLEPVQDRLVIRDMVATMEGTEFSPAARDVTTLDMTPEDAEAAEKAQVDQLLQALPRPEELASSTLTPVKFDPDSELHMDFITAASSLQAQIYDIPPTDRLKSKLLAGKLLPSIVTTSSVVAGLTCLELYKLIQGHTKVESYKNRFVNLAMPLLTFAQPAPPPKLKYHDTDFTLWDRFVVQGEMTLQEFLNYFEVNYKIHITLIAYGTTVLYAYFLSKSKLAERMGMMMSELVRKVTKRDIPTHQKSLWLELCCEDTDEEDLEVPFVQYILPAES